MINRTGKRYGMLVAVSASEYRDNKGGIKWICQCDCGNTTLVTGSNLTSGRTQSCGCLKTITSSERAKRLFTKEKVECSVDGCKSLTGPGAYLGLCGKHRQRLRRYGDVEYITSEIDRRKLSRTAQLKRHPEAKDTTYRKLFGRHEHRVVAELKIGRKLSSDEHVHHIDGDKHNNHPDNLSVMTKKDHLALHAKMRKK
jgi:hypothetical protein